MTAEEARKIAAGPPHEKELKSIYERIKEAASYRKREIEWNAEISELARKELKENGFGVGHTFYSRMDGHNITRINW